MSDSVLAPRRVSRTAATGMRRLLGWLPAERAVLAGLFLVCCLPCLVMLALLVPPGEVPDEQAHLARADSVRHGQFMGRRQANPGQALPDAVVFADRGIVLAAFPFPTMPLQPLKQVTAALEQRQDSVQWENQLTAFAVPNTATYPPFFYVPAAAAIQVAKQVLGWGPAQAILAARFANALGYAVLAVSALLLACRSRLLLFVLLSLPMSLSLGASVNHDGWVIACSALAAALLSRGTVRGWWSGTVLLALVIMAKPFLLPFALLPGACMPGRWRVRAAMGSLLLVAGPALLWAGLVARFVAVRFVRGPAAPAGPLWPGPSGTVFATTDPGEQLRVLLASPFRLLTLPAVTIHDNWFWLWRSFLGLIGTLDVLLPDWAYWVWVSALGCATLAWFVAARGEPTSRPIVQAVVPAAACLSLWLTFIAQYLSWTRVGDALVDGLQGRYFIPIAMLAVVGGGFVRLGASRTIRGVLLMAPATAALLGLGLLPVVLLHAYYIR